MTAVDQEKTGLGNYFIANYPPFSAWKPTYLSDATAAIERPPVPGTPLGLYLHIPFCRKRCKFCYFRVYTDKNAKRCRDVHQCPGEGSRGFAADCRSSVIGNSITFTSEAARRRT